MATTTPCGAAGLRLGSAQNPSWRVFVAGLLAALLCAMAAASRAETLPVDVLLVGDSITFGGFFVGDGGDGFEALLPDLLSEDFRVINAGCGGASSRDWFDVNEPVISRDHGWVDADVFETVVAPHLPVTIASILIGTNDAKGFDEPSPTLPIDYASAMDELIAELFDRGVDEIILMTPPRFQNDFPATVRVSEYRDYLLEKCSSHEEIHCGPDLYQDLHI